MLRTILFVGLGSCTGGMLRFVISRLIQSHVTISFPLATLLVNIVGCFIIGMFYAMFEAGHLMNSDFKAFLTVGFCGGFTTFSTFIIDNFTLLKDQNYFYFAFYLALSIFIGFIMLYLGYTLIKLL